MKTFTVRNILIGLGIILVVIQFIPRSQNKGEMIGEKDIATIVPVPAPVSQILEKSCTDCHSDHTHYPWYSHIQPIGFWLYHHVDEGKHELNFSAFAGYSTKRQLHKLDEIIEVIEKQEMPLSSYTLIHRGAKLTPEQQTILIKWAKRTQTILKDTLNH
jgi:exonuclease VII small subunit